VCVFYITNTFFKFVIICKNYNIVALARGCVLHPRS